MPPYAAAFMPLIDAAYIRCTLFADAAMLTHYAAMLLYAAIADAAA